MCYWEMLASCLHKGNCGYKQILYYFNCNGTGMEFIESEGTHAVGKCPCYPIQMKLKVTVKYYNLCCIGTVSEIHRYYQWQEEKAHALALDLTVVAQCIILRERG